MGMNFAPYERVKGCGDDGRGAVNLLYWLDKESPWARTGSNWGVFNCRNVAGSTNRSKHGRWRAFDLGLPLVNGRAHPIGIAIVRALGEKGRRLGLDELIWDRRYYDERTPDGRHYDGVSPHRDHIHGGLTLAATRNLTVASVRLIMAGITPELSPTQWAELRRMAAADLIGRVQQLPHMWLNNAPHPLYVVTLRQALNLVLREDLPVDGIYDADQDWQVQRFQAATNRIAGRRVIPENPGTFADHTKVYLVKALTDIRDGR